MELTRDPDLEWLDHVRPVGLVVAPNLLKGLGLAPLRQGPLETAQATTLIDVDGDGPALPDPWAFVREVLGWQAVHVAGAPGGPVLDETLSVRLPEHGVTLAPDWAVRGPASDGGDWRLLVRLEPPGVELDRRGELDGWEATPQQRFERLLRETGVPVGLTLGDTSLRLTYAPKGETSGHLSFPIRPLASVAGRPMLGGLKLLLDSFRLFSDAEGRRLPALLKKSRDAQNEVSTELAVQVLGALHELLRGFDAAEPEQVRALAADRPGHLYEGLLAVLMRLVFILYAEDRDLLPSRSDGRAQKLYEQGYSVRGLYGRLLEDAALNPDTMDERRGGWGRLLALFRLIHGGHASGFVQARGGQLFDPQAFPFLEGRAGADEPPRVPTVSDGCLLRVLEGLMTLKPRGGARERLSYRTLDVEQIGSVYETVMGFTVHPASGQSLAIKAGKKERTPVFVDLDHLAKLKGKERLKWIKETTERGKFPGRIEAMITGAVSSDELLLAFTTGSRDGVVDERGSPRAVPAARGAPLLQPTDERRRTGSHYTPRSLTAPIVTHALTPAFARLGPDATAEQVLELKVCDPAMGSGAFLVEACRQLGERLTKAWALWPQSRPAIPADEDEELHARRLVAQRCLYGVDRNPRAVDLARLSLWLATLARDHEFAFLDHALKCGDSLVGLPNRKIVAVTFGDIGAQHTVVEAIVASGLEAARQGRKAIRDATDEVAIAIQQAKYRFVEEKIERSRIVADALLEAFFSGANARERQIALARVEEIAGSYNSDIWERLGQLRERLRRSPLGITSFHWELEFPEVFDGSNPGFDVVVGNPPFAGKNTVASGHPLAYPKWLQTLHPGAHGNADLVAHFFRRAFSLLKQGGVFGLIATNTIGQGDTRASGLTAILQAGGAITRATRRLKWPGEAAVMVSVVHAAKEACLAPMLDGRVVRRVSAYLVEGDLDVSPAPLVANGGKAFVGSYVLGMGFTFDDEAAAKGEAESLGTMEALKSKDSSNAERIFPYIGGEEVSTDPRHAHRRYVIDFANYPLQRETMAETWLAMDARSRIEALREGIVPLDYPEPAAADWPDLLEIITQKVKPARLKLQDNPDGRKRKKFYWQFGRITPGLSLASSDSSMVLATGAAAVMFHMIAKIPSNSVYSHKLVLFPTSINQLFACIQARSHEIWSKFFGTTFGSVDALTYNPSAVFRTFPFPMSFEFNNKLEEVGTNYYTHRARLMIDRNEGMTKTYNRFHAHSEKGADIVRLRELHAEMDRAVLRAYGWDDLAERAAPEFIEQETEEREGKPPKTRLDWPSAFKDEVLARLLALNAERAAAERAAGLVATSEDDADAADEEGADEDAVGSLI